MGKIVTNKCVVCGKESWNGNFLGIASKKFTYYWVESFINNQLKLEDDWWICNNCKVFDMYENHPCEHDLYTKCDCERSLNIIEERQIANQTPNISKLNSQISDVQTKQEESEEIAQIQTLPPSSDN
jgi:hypothetical protein